MTKSLLIFAILAFIAPINLYASDYAIADIKTEIYITDDGTIQVKEHLTYVFDGTFSWAQYSLPMDGFSEIRNIRVSEQEKHYINENSEETGTFSVSESNNSVLIKWHYIAADTSRVFTLSYNLTGALTIGHEVAEFFWNYLSSNRDKSTEQLNITVTLPESVPSRDMHAWSRLNDDKVSITAEDGIYTIHATDLSRRESAPVRIVFPVSVLDQNLAEVTDADFSLDGVLQEEEQLQREAEKRALRNAFYASITPEVTLIISLLSIVIFILLYRKYSIRHSTKTISDRETLVIPNQNPPALVGRLLMNMSTANHLVATVFDLARRGWFVIREEKPEEKKSNSWFSLNGSIKSEFLISSAEKEPADTPDEYEQMVLQFVEKQVSRGENKFSEIFSGNSTKTAAWYSKWQKNVKKSFDEQGWIDKSSYTGVTLNMVAQFMLMAAAIYLLIVGTFFAIIALATTFVILIASFAMIRKTKAGEETYRRWKAYRKALKNADKQIVRMEMMDRHFIYATAFHFSEKQINVLIESADQPATRLFPWIILAQGSVYTPASVASSVSALAASGTHFIFGRFGRERCYCWFSRRRSLGKCGVEYNKSHLKKGFRGMLINPTPSAPWRRCER
ncbi:DUF2207 domain-containing protein [soil metagenome]